MLNIEYVVGMLKLKKRFIVSTGVFEFCTLLSQGLVEVILNYFMPFRFDDFFLSNFQLIDLFSICRTGNGNTQFELLQSLDDFFPLN